MSIMGFIQQQKDKFRNQSVENQKKKILMETEHLRSEKVRQGQIAKVNSELQKERRDLDAIRSYNQKANPSKPNHLMMLGQNLAKHMNETKQQKAVSSKAHVKGIKRLQKVSEGSHGIQLGMSHNPFMGENEVNKGAFEMGNNDKDHFKTGSKFEFGGKNKSPFIR